MSNDKNECDKRRKMYERAKEGKINFRKSKEKST
jgi:hypothetical protein